MKYSSEYTVFGVRGGRGGRQSYNLLVEQGPEEFYSALAADYHWIFQDWEAAIVRQANIFGPLIERALPAGPLRILDCACGIGTQALGLALRGHTVAGSDISSAVIGRARNEALRRGLKLDFYLSSMCDLAGVPESEFDAVLVADNALPHLATEMELEQAANAIASKLRHGGVVVATIRDYDRILEEHPTFQQPAFYRDAGRRRIMFQLWDWLDERRYTFHLYITRETETGWDSKHFASTYRALRRAELDCVLARAGFEGVEWLFPEASGFYQPVVMARKPAGG